MTNRIKHTSVSLMAVLIAAALSLCIAPSAFAATAPVSDATQAALTLSEGSSTADAAGGDSGAEDDEEGAVGATRLFDETVALTQTDSGWETELLEAPEFEGTLALADPNGDFKLFDADGDEVAAVSAGNQFRIKYSGQEDLGDSFEVALIISNGDAGAAQAVIACTIDEANGDSEQGDEAKPSGDPGDEGENGNGANEDAGEDGDEDPNATSGAESDAAEGASATTPGTSSDSTTGTSGTSSGHATKAKGSSKGSSAGSSTHAGKPSRSGHSHASPSDSSGKAKASDKSGKSGKSSKTGKSQSSPSESDGADSEQNDKRPSKGKSAKDTSTAEQSEQSTSASAPDAQDGTQTNDEEPYETADEDAARLAILSTAAAAAGLTGAYVTRRNS